MANTNTKIFEGVVEKIVHNGRHGAYAVARTEELGVVTFALDGKVWCEKHQPEPGDCVILMQIVSHVTSVNKKRAVWRAKQARAVTPSDEQ